MALTQPQSEIVKAKAATFTDQERAVLGTASLEDLTSAFAEEIVGLRGQSMTSRLQAILTGSVSNWPGLQQAAALADKATMYPALTEFRSAMQSQTAPAMLASAVSLALASLKYFHIPEAE